MSREQTTHFATDHCRPFIAATHGMQTEHRDWGMHSHSRGQLSGLRRGLLTMGTETDAWVVPAEHAVWLPPHYSHHGYTHGEVEGWNCYISKAACARLPDRPYTFKASGLLCEAVIRASQWKTTTFDDAQKRIAMIILDELRTAPIEPFNLPLPSDPRLLRIARGLLDAPGDKRGLDAWAKWAGVSERTLSRRFVTETGYNFTAWRQRARLMQALEMLAEGAQVTNVAIDLGYDSVSAFIALFKRTFGVTPTTYFSDADRS